MPTFLEKTIEIIFSIQFPEAPQKCIISVYLIYLQLSVKQWQPSAI